MLTADWGALIQPAARNHLEQAVGEIVEGWQGASGTPALLLEGRTCRLERLSLSRHSESLFCNLHVDSSAANWTYMNQHPFEEQSHWRGWLQEIESNPSACYYAIVGGESGEALGLAAWMNIQPLEGSVEIGGVHFSPRMQRGRMATEALYLMMRQVFEQGFRRCEWKCDAHNAASARAALRLGFTFECLWRQLRVSKGRNRDAACFSMLDHEWPARRLALERWLMDENFDAAGCQRHSLAQIVASLS